MKPMAEKHRAKRERKFKKKKGAWAKEMGGTVEVSDHAMERCAECGVTRKDIQNTIQYGKAERISKDKVVFRHHDKTVVVKAAETRRRSREKDNEKQTASYKVVTVISGAANAPTNSKG